MRARACPRAHNSRGEGTGGGAHGKEWGGTHRWGSTHPPRAGLCLGGLALLSGKICLCLGAQLGPITVPVPGTPSLCHSPTYHSSAAAGHCSREAAMDTTMSQKELPRPRMREVRSWSHRSTWGLAPPGCKFYNGNQSRAGAGRWCGLSPAWGTTSSRPTLRRRTHGWGEQEDAWMG